MNGNSNHRKIWAMVGAIAGVVIIVIGILFLVKGDQTRPPGSTPTVSNTPPPSSTVEPSTTSRTTPTTPSTTPAAPTMMVKVYFNDDASDPSHVVAMERTVARSPRVATATLTELLAGPTAAERNAGYFSWFSPATSGMLRTVRVHNGVAYVDFRDFRTIIPNASTSAGSAMLMAQLDTTLKQFPTIASTVYSFNGDVDAFYLWLQLTPPPGH